MSGEFAKPRPKPASKPRGRWLPRFGIRTLLLLTAGVAVWTSYFVGRARIEKVSKAIEAIHPLAPEIYVRNEHEYSCIAVERDDDLLEYQCYVPPGGDYQLHLVAHGPFTLFGKIKPEYSAKLTPGKHRVILDEQPNKVVVTVDDAVALEAARDRPVANQTARTGASGQFRQQWHPASEPLTLLRLHETTTHPSSPQGDSNFGIALWIDRKK